LDRVTTSNENYRYLVRGFGGSERLGRTNREDYVHTKLDKVSGELREMLLFSFGVTPLDEQILAFNIAKLAKPPLKCGQEIWASGWRARLNVPDFSDPNVLLRPRRQRPRRRAADSCNEGAPFHVWMAPAWQEIM
jgi:hypothetical protein